jgi:dUTP pyrophosphatase
MPYTLKIKMIDVSDRVSSYYKDFKNHHEGDSGIDLICPVQLIVSKNIIGTIDFKIQCEMRDKDNNLVSYYLYPRSSISKTPFMMANSVGIIDAGYRGNIMAKIRSFGGELEVIDEGSKLFQICAPDLSPIKVEVVDELSETSRGSGGFGSTNK